MTKLSFTQEFVACAINEKGKVPMAKKTEIIVGLLIGGILELTNSGYVELDVKNKYSCIKTLGDEKKYLQPLYDLISTKPMKIIDIANKYMMSDKPLAKLLNAIGESLYEVECAEKTTKKTLFGEKIYFVPTEDCVNIIVDKIRYEVLKEENVSEDMVILSSMLDNSRIINNYFSKFESEKLKRYSKEIKSSDVHKKINKLINELTCVIFITTN